MNELECFKAYDIRGKVSTEINPDFAYNLGRAYASEFLPENVVIGHDIRESSLVLYDALAKGLLESGVNVIALGLCGTEEVSFQTSNLKSDGGIMVTASHNPMDYNGMKLSLKNSAPLGKDTGLWLLKDRIKNQEFKPFNHDGRSVQYDDKTDYINHLLSYVDLEKIKPLKIVANTGNGCAALALELLMPHLPIEWIKINYELDGSFPNGIPNPLLPENRQTTSRAVIEHQADFGIAWDGDCDRCFFFDHEGNFIEGYYLMGLIAQQMLIKHPKSKIVMDTRLTWNTEEIAHQNGGEAIISKGGHSCIKQTMREVDAIYGGEMSAHHYFKSFFYCDSGMIPWLLIAELISVTDRPLKSWVEASIQAFPCTGELNYKVRDSDEVIKFIENYFAQDQPIKERLDGLTLIFPEWRLNVRASNTEPLLRLNMESRGDLTLLTEKKALVESLINLYRIG